MTLKHRAHCTNSRSGTTGGASLSAVACATLALCAVSAAPAFAFEIDTGNPNAVLRWDNTVRYNYGVRMKERDPAIINNPAADDGNRNFAKGQAVTNRLDLLSELDLVVDKKYGLRVSAAAWADAAYGSLATDANNPAYYNGTSPNALSDYTNRFAKGPSGEILDAFLFTSFDLGDTPVSARLGRHTSFWGEGMLLFGAIHGVSYGQSALDIWKSSANPGTESKELYRPRNGLTVQIQPSNTLSISAQAFFDWEPARVAESGSYLGSIDASLFGGQTFKTTALAGPAQGQMITPKKTGDWGLSARWSPEWMDGTMGFYARRTSELANQGWLALDPGTAPVASNLKYHFSFASNIDVLGLSLNKVVNGISVGAETSFRKNMPLVSQPATSTGVAGATIPGSPIVGSNALWALANNGDVPGARGETAHAVLNLTGIIPSNPLFDIASLVGEFTWSRVLAVNSDPFNLYKGLDAYANANVLGAANIDAVTRDATTFGMSFNPSWLQALPETDISMPVSYSVGLNGQSGVVSGGAQNSGTWSIGVVADYKAKYNFALRYISAFGPYTTTKVQPAAFYPPVGAAAVAPGYAPISDRDMLVFTFKTTF
ncbi:MAG: DUF1302 domain-containing protein [Rhodoferax sp.]|nr:DUF1302 domain-containing protein [Rhodoferax sp.]